MFTFDHNRLFLNAILAMLVGFCASKSANAQVQNAVSQAENESRTYRRMVDRSVEYLRFRGQAEDGSFSSQAGIGPTGLVVAGLLSVGVPVNDPMLVKALDYLERHVQPNGGIYSDDSQHRNYDTCIALMAFAKANQSGNYSAIMAKGESFVRGIQWDESEDKDPSDLFYGGAGYGSHSRPDLSNTAFFIEALKSLGADEDDADIQKALLFVSRCQNLEGPHNTTEFASKINDGGFYYTIAAGGETKSDVAPNGGLRSYGSMTYAGLKSMIYAGVSKDDPRVKAATDFLRKHYDLESNPGVGHQGLFYYYHTMSKTLKALGDDRFLDSSGESHQWKSELRNKLASVQQPDGSWVNQTTRWMEGDPNLVCGYTLLALANCAPAE